MIQGWYASNKLKEGADAARLAGKLLE